MSKINTDQEIIDRCDTGVKHRRKVELAIIHRLIQDLTAAGYVLTYDNGEDDAETNISEQQGVNILFSVDHSMIVTRKDGRDNWISLIGGNGVDIISDYGQSLDLIVSPIYEWIEEQQSAGNF